MSEGFNQVRVTEIVEIEFDHDPDDLDETIARLFLRSRTGDQLAIELPFSTWARVQEALAVALREFPEGQRRQ